MMQAFGKIEIQAIIPMLADWDSLTEQEQEDALTETRAELIDRRTPDEDLDLVPEDFDDESAGEQSGPSCAYNIEGACD